MFESVLVANRGEIAVRICKTLRRMGVRSVVVASIPDRRSLAVRTADDRVLLEGYSAAETYLDVDEVIAAAKAKGCEAIHPGYGFLSERPDFAERCAAEGIVFIGPPPGVLRAVGDKSSARRLAMEKGVPVVPGWDGEDDDDTLIHEATRIGFPVMIKARGGGGGRGMRPVYDPHEMAEALESARREALAAFGDPRLLLEKLVTAAHHVEVQVVADMHGNCVHLGERDCSVQRRRQKLIEEAPSPVVHESLRAQLTEAALRIARAVGYVNAGTFEFLVAPALAPRPPLPASRGAREEVSPFYFLEVNPRLQVEHPVTEMLTGIDLVEWQLRVAVGEKLPLRQEEVRFEGHAIEFRINAEDPWNGFRPSSGRIGISHWGKAQARCDVGFEQGDAVPDQYDSLLGKVIVHAESREDALRLADDDLSGTYLEPLRTNVDLHREILRCAEFKHGGATVDWLERELPQMLESAVAPEEVFVAGAVAMVHPKSWSRPGGELLWLTDQHVTREVRIVFDDSRHGQSQLLGHSGPVEFRLIEAKEIDEVWRKGFRIGVGPASVIQIRNRHDGLYCDFQGQTYRLSVVPPPPLPRRAHDTAEGATAVVAPLAGTIASVKVVEGDEVGAGDLLLTLDAMKMEHRITATVAGTVASVRVGPGDVVREGDLLLELG